MSENFADRKAEAAALFEALEPLFGKAAILKAARDHADEKALPYPTHVEAGHQGVAHPAPGREAAAGRGRRTRRTGTV